MDFTFNKHALRVKQASFARAFSGKRLLLWRLVMFATLLGASALLITGNGLGHLLLGTSLLIFMLIAYYSWELKNLPGKLLAEATPPRALEQILSLDALNLLKGDDTSETLWRNLSKDWQHHFILSRLMLNPNEVQQQLKLDSGLQAVWQYALQLGRHFGLPNITPGVITASLLLTASGAETYLASRRLRIEDVLNVLHWQIRLDELMRKLQQKRSFGGIARDWAAGYTPLLNQFGSNISTEIERGAYQHLYLQTHNQAFKQVINALSQPTKNSVALVGETGSGKTSLVYAVAEQLLTGNYKALQYHKVIKLNAALIVSESKRSGNLEALVLHLMAEANRAGNIILFLDDATSFLTDQPGSVNLASVLMPLVQSSKVRLILALRPQEWQRLTTTAGDFAAALNYQAVKEPDEDTVIQVMQDQALSIEAETKTSITYQATREAYKLAGRYIQEQAFPGKGITLLRSAANYAQDRWVTPVAVQNAVESSLGVKVTEAADTEKAQLLNLEEALHQRMINQSYAVKAVSNALRRARAGVSNQNRPKGSFLFLGPTGVGKTELSKALADVYFGGVNHLIRVDMSEYSQTGSVDRLLAPSGNAGTFLTSVRMEPFSVILLDEVEKAAPEILNLLLQLLDEGHLTDSAGRKVSFKDAIIIATSNAGADIIRSKISAGKNLEDFSDEFIDKLIDSNQFKPELINRFDETVLFRPLTEDELMAVVGLLIKEVNQTLAGQKITVELTEAATKAIVKKGYDPRLGARPMRRMVQRSVENVVAKRMLENQLQAGGTAKLDVGDLDLG